jgi:FkbM family methyltransferase
MSITRILKKIIFFLFFLFRFRSFSLAFNFAHYNFPLQLAEKIRRKGKYLEFTNTGNLISVKFATIFRQEYAKMIVFYNDTRVKVLDFDDLRTTVKINDIVFHLQSLSNIVTVYELFIETIYDFDFGTTDNVIVDIGMNVGYASLLFAANNATTKVYSYEPFRLTYEEASANLALNKSLQQKITANNYGISDYEGSADVPLMDSGDGGASTNKDILKINGTESLPVTTVKIKDISTELTSIIHNHPGQSIYLKVDCEGEEYPIFESLNTKGLIDKAAGYIIEWHLKGPEPILSYLQKAGFVTLNLPKYDATSGMIYAIKKSR